MQKSHAALIWAAVAAAVIVPFAFAAISPELAWREPVYVVAGFAGVFGLGLLLFQPLLARNFLPGINTMQGRRAHRWVGFALVASVLIHVIGLWLTSPPDVIDALLFASPTPFSVWGVTAMWTIFLAAALASFRKRLRIPPRHWRKIHVGLAIITVLGTVIHAVLIQGTMEVASKIILCAMVIGATTLMLFRNGSGR